MSDFKPTVAICIPTYNQAKFIGEAIRSAVEQDYRPIEIWISDDASTDDTAAVVKDFLGGSTPVNYFKQPVNCGIARNNNWLLSQPNTEYIVRLDSDDVLEPGYVSSLLGLLQEYPKAGYGHGAVYEIDQSGHSSRVRRLFRSETFEDAEGALRKASGGYRVAANMCMFRTRALREADFYREVDPVEDWDLSVRIADLGWGNVYAHATLGRYRAYETNSRLKRKQRELLGIESVLRESLMKAYERRGWHTVPILHAMRRFALAQSDCLSWNCYSEDEKRELQSTLYRLGGSSRMVSFTCWMMRHGFAWIFRIRRGLTILAKDVAKAVLSFGRSA